MRFTIPKRLCALGADPMGEICIGVTGDEDLHFQPAAIVVADLLAPRTDRQKAGENPNLFEGLLQLRGS